MSQNVEQTIPSLVAESRHAQRLPEHVEDPAALTQIAALLRAAAHRQAPKANRRTVGRAASPQSHLPAAVASPRDPGPPAGVGACSHPQAYVNTETGEIVWGRCKATSVDRCPYCASIYGGDAKTIISAGVWQHLGVGRPVALPRSR